MAIFTLFHLCSNLYRMGSSYERNVERLREEKQRFDCCIPGLRNHRIAIRWSDCSKFCKFCSLNYFSDSLSTIERQLFCSSCCPVCIHLCVYSHTIPVSHCPRNATCCRFVFSVSVIIFTIDVAWVLLLLLLLLLLLICLIITQSLLFVSSGFTNFSVQLLEYIGPVYYSGNWGWW